MHEIVKSLCFLTPPLYHAILKVMDFFLKKGVYEEISQNK